MNCLDEGTLQAYLDGELPEAAMGHTAAHLEACAACRERMVQMEATARRVALWLDALAADAGGAKPGTGRLSAPRPIRHRLPWAAVAASIAMFLALNRSPQPVLPLPRVAAPPAPAELVPVAAQPKMARISKPQAPRPPADFVAFEGADPMQLGMVVRVMVPVSGTQEVAADVVIGEDGRARAIRFIE